MNYLLLKDSLVLNFKGNTITVLRSDGRFEKIVSLIKEGKLDEIEQHLDLQKNLSEKGFEIKHGIVYINDEALPSELSNRLLAFYDEDLPYEPLLKFWSKLKSNPSYNSRQMLYKFLEHNGHPITSEGNFIAYRSITKDFKDHHTKTIDNSIGNVVEVPRSTVDDNPNNTCSKGLHVATLSYAESFGSSDRLIVDVEVDPRDVVAVPTDYNGTKMRVCKFKVVAISKGLIEKPLVKSSYGSDFCFHCGADILDETVQYCYECGGDLDE